VVFLEPLGDLTIDIEATKKDGTTPESLMGRISAPMVHRGLFEGYHTGAALNRFGPQGAERTAISVTKFTNQVGTVVRTDRSGFVSIEFGPFEINLQVS
jgi:hypothetical protein